MEAIHFAKSADGARIAYSDSGQGDQSLIYARTFTALGQETDFPEVQAWNARLSSRMRLLRLEMRGSGLSEREAAIGEDLAAPDILAVADAAGLQRFSLMAVGSQTASALIVAKRHPERVERSVIWEFVNGGTHSTNRQVRAQVAVSDIDADAYAQLVVRGLVGDRLDLLPRWTDLIRGTYTGEAFVRAAAVLRDHDAFHDIDHITCPTLVVANVNGNYGVADSQRLVSQLNSASLLTHKFPHLFPELLPADADVLAAVVDFLTGQSPASPVISQTSLRTLLFTDLEGHTAMMSRLGDAKGREVLREHERITREALAAHGGQEVKTMGDGFMASFGSAQRALECAVALQRAVAGGIGGEALRIRAGINAGEPIAEDDDLFGSSVIAAARIAGKAAGGQVLVSDVVRQLVAGKGFLFSDAGIQELKGLEEPVRLWELRWEA